MRFFGSPWESDATAGMVFEPSPAGQPCAGHCNQLIGEDDQGMFIPHLADDHTTQDRPWHYSCYLHEIGRAPCPRRRASTPTIPPGLEVAP